MSIHTTIGSRPLLFHPLKRRGTRETLGLKCRIPLRRWGGLEFVCNIWWGWNWRTPSVRFGAIWGGWRIWATVDSRRMPLFTIRIEDNSFQRKNIWFIFWRVHFSSLQCNFIVCKIKTNSWTGKKFLSSCLWVSW